MRIPIILDCDPGHDDAIALMLALGNKEIIDLKCISTVGGNQILDKTTRNALQLLELMDETVPVVKGMAKPLVRPLEIADSVHGDSGMDGPSLPPPHRSPSDSFLLDMYARILEESEEKITFVVTGPQTNMALLLIARPDLKAKIKQIVFMGGACFGGNWSPHSEFNIYVDPEAAQVVASSGLPVVMCGLDVTHKATITVEEIQRFRNIGNKTGVVFAELLDFFSKTSDPDFLKEEEGPKIRLHDVTTIAYLLKPEIFETRDLFVSIDMASNMNVNRGSTIVDYTNSFKKEPNMKVCFNIDREKFIDLLFNSISKLP